MLYADHCGQHSLVLAPVKTTSIQQHVPIRARDVCLQVSQLITFIIVAIPVLTESPSSQYASAKWCVRHAKPISSCSLACRRFGGRSREPRSPLHRLVKHFDIPGKLHAEKATFGDPETQLLHIAQ